MPDNNPQNTERTGRVDSEQHGRNDEAVRNPQGDHGAGLAHELANLLDGSLRNVSLVINRLRKAADAEEHSRQNGKNNDQELLYKLDVANHAMQQMATLIHRWMKTARSSADLHQQSCSLGKMMDDTVMLLAPAIQQRGIELIVNLESDLEDLPAGPVYPIVVNAIRNSIDAIDNTISTGEVPLASHRIELDTRSDGDHVVISVSDTGGGIPSELLDESGNFRFGVSTKTEGHGLGLMLSREIAASMGGELTITNRSPQGAVLVLRYPRHHTGSET